MKEAEPTPRRQRHAWVGELARWGLREASFGADVFLQGARAERCPPPPPPRPHSPSPAPPDPLALRVLSGGVRRCQGRKARRC